MTARMTAVRSSLELLTSGPGGWMSSDTAAALAEVEEWEAEVQRLGDDVAEQALRIIDLGQKENEAVARAEAAEAEADRLRAAVEDYLLWEPRKAGHAAAHERLRHALAPADRNTT